MKKSESQLDEIIDQIHRRKGLVLHFDRQAGWDSKDYMNGMDDAIKIIESFKKNEKK